MRLGFLPVRDIDLLNWGANAATRIQADGDGYGLSSDQVAAFVEAQARFAEAMERVRPAIRCSASVIVKDESRLALEIAARRLNAQVRGAGVADDERLSLLGLTIRKTRYRRIGTPTIGPNVRVRSVDGPTMTLAIRAPDATRATLPDDVAGVWLSQWVGDEPPADVARWPVVAQVSRSRLTLPIHAPLGTPVHFVARYLNRRGEAGPWGVPTRTFAMGEYFIPRSLAA